MDIESIKLFLLEFLVDSVQIQQTGSFEDSSDEWMLGEMCVTFQFLDYPPLEICEQDFPKKSSSPTVDSPNFKSGKSCLFAMPNQQLVSAPGEFCVDVAVIRKLPPGVLPEKMTIGQTKVDLTDDFTTIIGEIVNNPLEIPVSKTLKDSFILGSTTGCRAVGTISIFVRLSCFGKLIVTQFQLGGEKSFLFKGSENSEMYQCKKVDPNNPTNEDLKEVCSVPDCPAKRSWNDVFGYGGNRRESTIECVPAGGEPDCACPNAVNAQSKNKRYEEIGAEVNGHCLTIRVPKDKKNNNCGCESQRGAQSTDGNANKHGSGCPCVCKDGGGFVVQIPERKPSSQGNNYKVINPCPNIIAQTVEPCSPPAAVSNSSGGANDVFVLRIGKKSTGTDHKSQLELELRTPKREGPPPPPITTETKETQYLATDTTGGDGKEKGKNGKDKGKKGKGKGKGKGKKKK